MYNRNDPRFRRTLNQISQNLESANESAQVGLFDFSEHYVKPCLGAVAEFLEPCTAACFPSHRDRLRQRHHHHQRGAGRLEHSFDFYDDWEHDENDALLALEDDELERLVGSPPPPEPREPRPRRGIMSYGTRGEGRQSPRARRKSAVLPYDVGPDPTVIPNQSYFGFLTKLPFKLGRGGLRYKPSAADLQVRPKEAQKLTEDGQAILEEEEGEEGEGEGDSGEAARWQSHGKKTGRGRSGTTGSGHTTDSYSSRGDIFPSDDEDDAVPIGDEFTIALERRTTNTGPDDGSSGKGSGRRRTDSSQHLSDHSSSKNSRKGRKKKKRKSSSSRSHSSDPEMGEVATLAVLQQGDERAQGEEEEEIEMKTNETSSPAAGRVLAGLEDEPVSDPETIQVADGPISLEDNERQPSPRPREGE